MDVRELPLTPNRDNYVSTTCLQVHSVPGIARMDQHCQDVQEVSELRSGKLKPYPPELLGTFFLNSVLGDRLRTSIIDEIAPSAQDCSR